MKKNFYSILGIVALLFYITLSLIPLSVGDENSVAFYWGKDQAGNDIGWHVKSGGPMGPGNNLWGIDNAWLDKTTNEVHLKLSKSKTDGNWYCAEIYTDQYLNFGKYQFWVTTPLDNLDPNVVFGMFNYPDNVVVDGTNEMLVDGTNEIDIEVARWGNPQNPNLNYGFYPSWNLNKGQIFKYPCELILNGDKTSTHRFIWQKDSVYFQSLNGFKEWGDNSDQINSAKSSDYVASYIPQVPLRVHINLYLYENQTPAIDDDIVIVLKDFSFTKEGSPSNTPEQVCQASGGTYQNGQCIMPSVSSSPFKVTSGTYSETADLDQAVKNEFGNDYRVADWNDILAYSGDIESWANGIGMKHGDYCFVTWKGQGFWNGGNRHYFITRFDHVVDSGYLVHDQIENNFITLGSWYGIQERILAIKTTGNSTPPSSNPGQNTPRTNEYWPGSTPTACTPGSAYAMCKSSNSCVDCSGHCYSEGRYTSSQGYPMVCSQGKWIIGGSSSTPPEPKDSCSTGWVTDFISGQRFCCPEGAWDGRTCHLKL